VLSLTSATVTDGRPYCFTRGEAENVDGKTNYIATMGIRFSRLGATGICTNLSKTAQYYVKAAAYSNQTTTTPVWNDAGLGLSNGYFECWQTTAYTAPSGSVYSAVMGDFQYADAGTVVDVGWCAEPSLGETLERGYEVTDELIIFDWDFERCTNSI